MSSLLDAAPRPNVVNFTSAGAYTSRVMFGDSTEQPHQLLSAEDERLEVPELPRSPLGGVHGPDDFRTPLLARCWTVLFRRTSSTMWLWCLHIRERIEARFGCLWAGESEVPFYTPVRVSNRVRAVHPKCGRLRLEECRGTNSSPNGFWRANPKRKEVYRYVFVRRTVLSE